MRRFLILFILIVFSVVSCAGQKKWTKPDFNQDEFDKHREECLQAVKSGPQANLKLEECLAKKGYESKPEPEVSSDKEKSKTAETAKTVGKVLLGTALVAVAVAALAALAAVYVVSGALAAAH